MLHSGVGVQIEKAEGGYIVTWMERPKPSSSPGYVDPGVRRFPIHRRSLLKQSVRVTLEDALKVAGEVLSKMGGGGEEEDGEGEYGAEELEV
jgi:hypothetical protein